MSSFENSTEKIPGLFMFSMEEFFCINCMWIGLMLYVGIRNGHFWCMRFDGRKKKVSEDEKKSVFQRGESVYMYI